MRPPLSHRFPMQSSSALPLKCPRAKCHSKDRLALLPQGPPWGRVFAPAAHAPTRQPASGSGLACSPQGPKDRDTGWAGWQLPAAQPGRSTEAAHATPTPLQACGPPDATALLSLGSPADTGVCHHSDGRQGRCVGGRSHSVTFTQTSILRVLSLTAPGCKHHEVWLPHTQNVPAMQPFMRCCQKACSAL